LASIKEIIAGQVAWLKDMDASLIAMLKQLISTRYHREIATCHRLVGMIGETIAAAEPIRQEWLLAPDAIAVIDGRLIVPDPEPYPDPVINEFYDDRLNEEQVDVINQWIQIVRIGEVILIEDMHALLDRCLSGCGPLGNVQSSTGYLSHLTLPKRWRDTETQSGKLLASAAAKESEAVASSSSVSGAEPTEPSPIDGPVVETAEEAPSTEAEAEVEPIAPTSDGDAVAPPAESVQRPLQSIRDLLTPYLSVPGIEEHYGTIPVSEAVAIFRSRGLV
jgi:hypothetical protein